ncbi:MAG: metal-dependent hydrolase [Ignavibacteria bacterium]|nr:metal-dependent hydrolase [Ignavibacteria bacterium]
MVKVTYHGHSALEIRTEDHIILVDPFFTGNKHNEINPAEVKADFIILTHAHGDHIGDTVEIARKNDSLVIAVHELADYMASKGLRVHNMGIGGKRDFPFGRVKFTIAHHSSSIDNGEGHYMGEAAGVVITAGGRTIYHAGDTGLFLDMKLIGEMNHIDLAMLPIGDNFTMGIDDAVKAAEFINAGMVAPMHYNTFPPIETDPEEFRRKVESIGKKCIIMPFGKEIEI